jgi:hypothetical protein
MSKLARMKSATKAKLKYMHYNMIEEVRSGKSTLVEEQVIHGDDGVSFKYFEKIGDKMEKYSAKENKDGTFMYKSMKNGQAETLTLSKDELVKKMKSNKKLDFATKFMANQKGGVVKRKRKTTKKTTKKKSRKSSKR